VKDFISIKEILPVELPKVDKPNSFGTPPFDCRGANGLLELMTMVLLSAAAYGHLARFGHEYGR